MQTKSTEITGRCVILPKKMYLHALNNINRLQEFFRQFLGQHCAHLTFLYVYMETARLRWLIKNFEVDKKISDAQ